MSVGNVRVLVGDAVAQLATLPDASVDCVVTSPPYWGLRSYLPEGHPAKGDELGQETTAAHYITRLVAAMVAVRRVLKPRGTLWLNLADSYAHKQLQMVPTRVALALQDAGWLLRSDIIWHKPNAMPASVQDRPTSSYEHVFLLAQQPQYYYDAAAIAETAVAGDNGSYFDRGKTGAVHANQGRDRRDKQRRVGKRTYEGFNARWAERSVHAGTRNRRDVWSIPTQPYRGAHFAVWPEKLVELMILAGCPEGGTVLDPFAGSGTTLAVANRLGRHAVGIELNAAYMPLIRERCRQSRFVLAAEAIEPREEGRA